MSFISKIFGGGGSNTTTVRPKKLTKPELQMLYEGVKVVRHQRAAVQDAYKYQKKLTKEVSPELVGKQVDVLEGELPKQYREREDARLEQILGDDLERLRGTSAEVDDAFARQRANMGQGATAQQQGLINRAANQAVGAARADTQGLINQGQAVTGGLIRQGQAVTGGQIAGLRAGATKQIAAINQEVGFRRQQGVQDIKDILAPGRGLRPTDSPIQDRAFDFAAELEHQRGQQALGVRGALAEAEGALRGQQAGLAANLTGQQAGLTANLLGQEAGTVRTLRSQQAGATLEYPLRAGELENRQLALQQGARADQQAFQTALRDEAFQKRLLLGTSMGDLARATGNAQLGLAAGIPANPTGMAAVIRGAAPTTQVQSQRYGLGDFLMAGIGAAGSAAAGGGFDSSRRFKERLGEPDLAAVLRAFAAIPIDVWRYHETPDTAHVGPYAEDFRDLYGFGDGETIEYVDALGLLWLAVQWLVRRELYGAPMPKEAV